jgi:hypothetical protein
MDRLPNTEFRCIKKDTGYSTVYSRLFHKCNPSKFQGFNFIRLKSTWKIHLNLFRLLKLSNYGGEKKNGCHIILVQGQYFFFLKLRSNGPDMEVFLF